MRFNVIGRDQVFTHHPIVMWPSNTQPYDITLGTFEAWRNAGTRIGRGSQTEKKAEMYSFWVLLALEVTQVKCQTSDNSAVGHDFQA